MFAQLWNHVRMHFSDHIPIVKWLMTHTDTHARIIVESPFREAFRLCLPGVEGSSHPKAPQSMSEAWDLLHSVDLSLRPRAVDSPLPQPRHPAWNAQWFVWIPDFGRLWALASWGYRNKSLFLKLFSFPDWRRPLDKSFVGWLTSRGFVLS